MGKPVCAVVGIGPGNGAALAKRWAEQGHAVAMLTRNEETLRRYEALVPGSRGYACDATDERSVDAAFTRIRAELGPVDTLLYNAGSGVWGSLLDLDATSLRGAFDVNAGGLFLCAQAVARPMIEAGRGTIGVIGASAAWRGRAKTLAFAAAKAAQRSIAQSIARDLGPKGVHCFYVVIDGVIDLPRTREMMKDKPDDFFLQPDHVARAVWDVAQQPRSAWTFELDVRPFGETW